MVITYIILLTVSYRQLLITRKNNARYVAAKNSIASATHVGSYGAVTVWCLSVVYVTAKKKVRRGVCLETLDKVKVSMPLFVSLIVAAVYLTYENVEMKEQSQSVRKSSLVY